MSAAAVVAGSIRANGWSVVARTSAAWPLRGPTSGYLCSVSKLSKPTASLRGSGASTEEVSTSTGSLCGEDVAHVVATHAMELRGRKTTVSIEILSSSEDLATASICLTRSFAASPEYVRLADVNAYLENMLMASPARGVVLVAKVPSEEDGAPKVVGMTAVSFHRSTRDSFRTLRPQPHDAYLSNMAVLPAYRKQGLAKLLIAAAEDVARLRETPQMTLHVCLSNDTAFKLYQGCGYREMARDPFLVLLQGSNPRALLVKSLLV